MLEWNQHLFPNKLDEKNQYLLIFFHFYYYFLIAAQPKRGQWKKRVNTILNNEHGRSIERKVHSESEEVVHEGIVLFPQGSNELCSTVFLDPSIKEKVFD